MEKSYNNQWKDSKKANIHIFGLFHSIFFSNFVLNTLVSQNATREKQFQQNIY